MGMGVNADNNTAVMRGLSLRQAGYDSLVNMLHRPIKRRYSPSNLVFVLDSICFSIQLVLRWDQASQPVLEFNANRV